MTKNQIIEKLFTGKNFRECLSKMEPEHLREDLRQEVILVICELPEEKIMQMHRDKVLEFYTVRVILNQIKSKTSPFAKKYRNYHAGYTDNILYKEHGEEMKSGEVVLQQGFNLIRYVAKAASKEFVDDDIEREERELRETIEDMAIEEVDQLYWYNKGLIELYMKHGNFRAIQDITKIPFGSAYKTIQKSFEEIRHKVASKPVFTKSELAFIKNGKQ